MRSFSSWTAPLPGAGSAVKGIRALFGGRQGCIKLQFEGSPFRGGESLSPEFQAHSTGDKLSPPRKRELGWRASRGRHQVGGEPPRTGVRVPPEFLSHSGWAGRGRFSVGFRFGGARKGPKGPRWVFSGELGRFRGLGDSRNRFVGYLLTKNRGRRQKNRRRNRLAGDQSRSFGKVSGFVGKVRPRDSSPPGRDGCRPGRESLATGSRGVGAAARGVGASARGVGGPGLAKIAAEFAKRMAWRGTQARNVDGGGKLIVDRGRSKGRVKKVQKRACAGLGGW